MRAAVVLVAATSLLACEDRNVVRLTLLGTTDVHGYLLPYDYATGQSQSHSLAQVVTLVDSIRAADPYVLLFDSGDLLQGSPLNSYRAQLENDPPLSGPHPVIEAMNAQGGAPARNTPGPPLNGVRGSIFPTQLTARGRRRGGSIRLRPGRRRRPQS